MMTVPRYDNVEHHFRHTDSSSELGREQVASLLGLVDTPEPEGLQYELSFFSGGIGVLDKHAIAMTADVNIWSTVAAHLDAKSPMELAADDEWGNAFVWLVSHGEDFASVSDAAIAFINSEQAEFQERCNRDMKCLFEKHSNVNDWVALWGTERSLFYLAYSQG